MFAPNHIVILVLKIKIVYSLTLVKHYSSDLLGPSLKKWLCQITWKSEDLNTFEIR